MREGPEVLVNALAGERVVFHTHAADTGGELIQFDLILTKVGGSPPAHMHLHQSERFQVRSGAIRVMIADQERVLQAGEEALVAAGTPHRWWNAGPGDALVSVEMRPGLHFEELLEEAFRLADEGKFSENGPIDQAATDRWATKWKGSIASPDGPGLQQALVPRMDACHRRQRTSPAVLPSLTATAGCQVLGRPNGPTARDLRPCRPATGAPKMTAEGGASPWHG